MSTSTLTTTTTEPIFEIIWDGTAYTVTRSGFIVTDRFGNVRRFSTRSSARKHITRERRGNFSN
jgi:hypothetical protein